MRQFFSEGQAYVAISRVRALEQIHLWCFDTEAFKVAPAVMRAYELLRARPLTFEIINTAAPLRTRLRHLLPLAGGAVAVAK